MGLLSILLLLTGLIYTAHCQGRGTVRLVRSGYSSSTYTAGIVQIYYFTSSSSANRWGNICDDSSFGSTEANVICNQLGYNGASTYGRTGSTTSYGTDSSATILDDVSCSSSNYLTLQQCTVSTFISSTCSLDSYDAYVVCYTTRIWNNPYSGQIRLQGGPYTSYGRLEVYCNGQWGTVCDDTFDATDARVACRQLGYSDYSTYTNLAGSSSQPIWLDNVSCSSSYTCLATCESCPSSQYHNCRHSEDVALGCEFDTLRLTSRNTLSSCRYANNRWGSTFTTTSILYPHAPIVRQGLTKTPTSTPTPRTNRSNARVTGIVGGLSAVFFISFTLMMTTILCLICYCSRVRNNAAPPPLPYNQQPPPTAYPAQPGYPPQEGYPPQGYAYPLQGYEAHPDGYPPQQGYEAQPPQQGYNSPPPYPAAQY